MDWKKTFASLPKMFQPGPLRLSRSQHVKMTEANAGFAVPDDTVEYDCHDCGAHVYQFGGCVLPRIPPRCAICSTLREHIPPEERAELRQELYDVEAKLYWATKGCWEDEAYAERKCDACPKMYRGPSMYCSLDCAQGDA
jgi:hypothetical protein